MKNKFTRLTLLTAVVLFLIQNISLGQTAVAPPLGTTAGFAVYTAVGAVNNDGASTITGDVGAYSGSLTGFPDPGTIIGTTHLADPLSFTAAADVAVAYGFLAAESADVIGIHLGGQTLLPGVHSTGGAAELTGTLTLDGLNNPNSIFVIKIDGAFATVAYAKVVLINSANVCNVYWQINGQVNLETYTAFQGTVIAAGPFNLFVGSTVSGRMLATGGAINLHTTVVTLPNCLCSVAAPTVGAIIQTTCAVATGSVVLSGLPAVGTWTINPGGITGTGTSKTLSGLTAGTHNYTVTDASGCISAPSGDVVINPALVVTPIVGTITQPLTCLETGSVVLSGLPAGNWTINPGAITGTGTTKTITGLAAGTHNYTVTDASGCISEASADVVINPIVAAPTVTLTQPTTCATPTGTITVTAPTGTGMTYSINGSTYTNANGIFTAVPTGTYTVTAKNADGCISPGTSVTIISSATPATPTVGAITQPTCFVLGSVVLSGLPAGNWTINPGAISGNTASTTISGLASGTYNFTVTNICGTSAPSANVVLNPLPVAYSAPTPGTVTQPTCVLPTGSVVLNGLPSGTWFIHESSFPLVVLGTGSGSSTTIYGLSAGTHNFTVTTADVCYFYSVASAPVVITAKVPTPTVTFTQPIDCDTHTGTITVTELPGDCYKYSIDGLTNTTGIFTDVPAGTYTVTAMNSDGCISSGVNVTIPSLPSFAAPIVGLITQPTSGVGGSVVLSGLPAGTWFINPGAIQGTGSSTTLTGLTPGTHNYTVTTAGVCYNYSAPSADIVINAATVAAPTVTLTQPTTYTTPTGTITITAPTGTGMTYSINGSTYSTNMVYTALPPGTYPVTAMNAAGYISPITSATINTAPSTVASATAQPTCLVATGTITVTAPAPGTGMSYSINGVDYTNTNGIFTGLAPGTYTVTSKNSAGNISLGTNVTIFAQAGPMAAPTVTLTQPTTCVSPTGTITVTAPTGTGMTYSINNGSTYTTSGIFTGLAPGTYPVTAKSADGCVTSVTSVTILAMPLTVATATAQPTSTLGTGTITVTAPTGTGMTYSIDGGVTYTTSGIFTGLAPGTYSVTSKSSDGCVSSVMSVTINPQPALPATPVVTLIQPTYLVPTGTITVTPIPGYCLTYSIVGNGVTYTNTTGIFTGLAPGTYTVTAKDWGGSISLPTSATISVVTAIKEIGVDQKFEIYPVPNNGQFTVVMSTPSEKRFDILITNALGSKIYQEKNVLVKGKLEHNINMGQVPAGMYYIMFRSGNEQVMRKIIISK